MDSLGRIGSQTPNYRAPEKTANDLTGAPVGFNDSFTPASSSKSSYIIIPPPGESKTGEIFKDNQRELKKLNVQVDEKLPVINGFTASLDDNKKAELTKAGYIIFEDDEKNWFPKDPALRSLQEIETSATGNDDKPLSQLERPKLIEPRFDTPLTRQFTGKGVGIAIIDSGIHPHPDLAAPNNRIVEFIDLVNGMNGVPYDDGGHGTHVAGNAAGNGLLSDGLYKGTAPEANIIGIKALKGQGGGKTSDVIKAIQWCIQNKDKHNIRVINMSLGHAAYKDPTTDPTNLAVQKAYDAGIVVVTSAGNSGPGPGTITAPADSPHAISVGAADDNNTPSDPTDDKVADFSSRGPTNTGLIKPDIMAPGEAIVSTLAPGTEASSRRSNQLHSILKWMDAMPDEALTQMPPDTLRMFGFADTTIERWMTSAADARKEIRRIFKAVQKTPLVDNKYVGKPGTSMASPMVAGIVAQMCQANPDLKPGDVFQILNETAKKLPGDVPQTDQGNGMVDPHDAIQKALDMKEGLISYPEHKPSWGNEENKGKAENKEK